MSLLFRAFWVLAALAGWLAYGYGWYLIVGAPNAVDFPDVLLDVGLTLTLLGLVSAYWIVHNFRLAREGDRGRATRWVPWRYERDPLDQPVEMAAGVEDARVVSVTVEGSGPKRFRPGRDAP